MHPAICNLKGVEMKAHVLQHVSFEDIGSIASWLKSQKVDLSYTRFFADDCLPDCDGLDLVIVLGGPMSANDEATLPWIRLEKEFIRSAIARDIPMIGICLGAQLIASALGARVYKNAHKEIGWFPIEATPRVEDTFAFPRQCRVFHWHGETFELPSGAVRLAVSRGCKNQAFQFGRHVIGLQFHLETTPESVRNLVDNCRGELIPGEYVQTEKELGQIEDTAYAEINSLMDSLLFYIMESSLRAS
jgi:GMP synthase-like glutamine amidotransferase